MSLPGLVKRADRIAKEYISKSDCHTGMYAEIVKGGSVIARGYNKRRLNGSVHAEMPKSMGDSWSGCYPYLSDSVLLSQCEEVVTLED